MKLRKLFTDDDAVSPVIGVILMVAITVILAAVIATFVLGLGESVSDTAPQASFSTDYDESGNNKDSFGTSVGTDSDDKGNLTITHSGGDKLKAKNLYVSGGVDNDKKSWKKADFPDFKSESTVTAGNEIVYAAQSDDTVLITWQQGSSDSSAQLDKWTGPDA